MAELKIEYIPIDELTPYDKNARKHEDYDVDVIAQSIERYGFSDPVGVWGSHNTIVEGHGRVMAAKKIGMSEVPCIRLDHLTDEQRKEYALIHNKSAELSTWDFDMLASELEGLDFGDIKLDWGLVPDEVSEDDIVEDTPPSIDDTEPICKEGDLWQLGDHRLICGDSTDLQVVQTLTGGGTVDCVMTDPPYNVDYTGGTDEHLKIQNDNKGSAEFESFLTEAFAVLSACVKAGGAFYIWHASRTQREFENALNAVGLLVREQLIWVKNALVLGRSDYQWRHEPCFYGWKDGESHYFVEDRTQTTVQEAKGVDFKKLRKDELVNLLNSIYSESNSTTVIHEDKPIRNGDHPTMKPVKLLSRLLLNSTKPNDSVLDTFGGSGSTLIACEQLKRKCYICELDPRYCDVIIARWEALTGKRAQKIN